MFISGGKYVFKHSVLLYGTYIIHFYDEVLSVIQHEHRGSVLLLYDLHVHKSVCVAGKGITKNSGRWTISINGELTGTHS